MARYVTGNIVLDEPWQRELHLPAPPVSEEVLGRTQSKSKEKAALSVGEKLRYLGYVLVLTVLFIGVLAVFAHYVQLHYETVQLEKQVRDISAMNEALRLEVAELKNPNASSKLPPKQGSARKEKRLKPSGSRAPPVLKC